MIRDEYGAARSAFHTRGIHTNVVECTMTRECRVCRGVIDVGTSMRSRPHGIEYAHADCGWLRPDEKAVHEVRRPGTSFTFYEWACPLCGLDACDVRKPDDETDMRCKRCEPGRYSLAVGKRCRVHSSVWVRVNGRKVTLRTCDTGRVEELFAGVARVRWVDVEGKRKCVALVPLDAIVRIP